MGFQANEVPGNRVERERGGPRDRRNEGAPFTVTWRLRASEEARNQARGVPVKPARRPLRFRGCHEGAGAVGASRARVATTR